MLQEKKKYSFLPMEQFQCDTKSTWHFSNQIWSGMLILSVSSWKSEHCSLPLQIKVISC